MAVSIVRAGVRWIERLLSRRYHVFEFSAEPDNILRVARMNSWREVVLSDGTVIHPGDELLVLHLWNERLPSPSRDHVNFGWRTRLGYDLRASARLLAQYLAAQSEFDDVRAIFGEMGLIAASQIEQAQRVAALQRGQFIGAEVERGKRLVHLHRGTERLVGAVKELRRR